MQKSACHVFQQTLLKHVSIINEAGNPRKLNLNTSNETVTVTV